MGLFAEIDLESINALNQAIQKYEGTVFLVTHDQDLIEEAGTRIWHFEGGPTNFHITDHKGPYEELGKAYQLLYGGWLPKSGYQLRDVPAFEQYLNSPQNTKPEDLVTMIHVPLSA